MGLSKLELLLEDIYMYRFPKKEHHGMITYTRDCNGVIIGHHYFRDIMSDPKWHLYIERDHERPHSYKIIGKPIYVTSDIDKDKFLLF